MSDRHPSGCVVQFVVVALMTVSLAACSGGLAASTTEEAAESSPAAASLPTQPTDGAGADDTAAAEEDADDGTGEGPSEAPPSPAPAPAPAPAPIRLDVTPLADPVTTLGLVPFAEDNTDAWATTVPQATEIIINASSDGAPQSAWWVAPSGPDEPVLVVLHSWSTPYDQQLSIPYARWALENGWGMIAPDFRGVNERPEATASDLAVTDVVDAVDFALAQGEGDPDRVFTVGFSGGAMMSVLMASRHPERFAGAIAWVPIYDLPAWYAYNAVVAPDVAYLEQIEASCGGAPLPGTPAEADCRTRSPSAWLDGAREAGVPIYLGVGLQDDVVPASNGARIYNQLATPEDRIPDVDVAGLAAGQLSAGLGLDPRATSFFGPADPPVLATRRSGPVTLVVFEGEHEMLYGPGISWLSRGLPAEG